MPDFIKNRPKTEEEMREIFEQASKQVKPEEEKKLSDLTDLETIAENIKKNKEEK